jgi:hypothetical protein
MQELPFYGIRVIYISQGIDTSEPQAEMLTAFRGIIDSSFLNDLAAKVTRGLAGQLEREDRISSECLLLANHFWLSPQFATVRTSSTA